MNASLCTIRNERPSDIPHIRTVNEQAFGQALEADVVDAIRRSHSRILSLVAECDSRVVGHILFSPATISSGGRNVEGMGLAPMAVLPEFQRMGIGSQLVRAGLTELRRRHCPFVIVLGHPLYYPRFGFERASLHDIRSEWDVPDDAFMILLMEKAALTGISGVACYLPEFAAAL